MKTVKVRVYEYKELSEDAKAKAREWFNGASEFFADSCAEDFETYLSKVGFKNVKSYYSGFCSQGDGACFDFSSLDFTTLLAAPQVTDYDNYEEIRLAWLKKNRALLKRVFRFSGRILGHTEVLTHRYVHAYTRSIFPELDGTAERCEKLLGPFEKCLMDLYRDLSNEFYRVLEEEYEYQTSDEYISEGIETNGYTFTKDGKRFG